MLTELLKELRQRRGLMQKEIADLLGISREHYAQIESGNTIPSVRLLLVISEKLPIEVTIVFSNGTCEYRYRTIEREENV